MDYRDYLSLETMRHRRRKKVYRVILTVVLWIAAGIVLYGVYRFFDNK